MLGSLWLLCGARTGAGEHVQKLKAQQGWGVVGSSVQGKREEHDQEVKQEAQTERGRNGISSLKQWKLADCS